jgi:hypothetical protein
LCKRVSTRNRYDSAIYKAKLKANGVRVLSAKENITDDASGVLIEGVLESFAEYYSRELSQKIKRGIDISASKCKYFGGSVPLGYKVDEQKNYVIDEETAPLLKTMFEMFMNGHNYADLERWLNERGISTSRGNKWNKNSFHHIFGNRRYLGKYIYQGKEIDGGIPRIIDDELFAEVQNILAKYRAVPARGKAKADYLLSGKLLCGYCGHKMTGVSATSKSKKVHHYYQCTENRLTGKCRKKSVRKEFIEDELIKEIVLLLKDELIDLLAAETYLLIQAEKNDGEIKRLEALAADNQKAINNLMKALMSGKVTDIILAQIEKLEEENKEFNALIATEKSLQMEYSYSDIRNWLLRFRSLDYTRVKNRRDLIDTFIYSVILYDNKMKVLFHLKGGQKGELLLNVIFPDYPDGDDGSGGEDNCNIAENAKEESDNSLSSLTPGCSYTGKMVEMRGVEPLFCKKPIEFSTCVYDE